MFEPVNALSIVAARSIDPTDHGANLGAVAGLAVAILAFIGLLVFLITRWGRAAPDPPARRAAGPRPAPGPDRDTDADQDAERDGRPA